MTYKLHFLPSALKEWEKLDKKNREQLKEKLIKVCEFPHVPKNKLTDIKNGYKIKLKSAGLRLVYLVEDKKIVVQVVCVGKRDKKEAYLMAMKRIEQMNKSIQ